MLPACTLQADAGPEGRVGVGAGVSAVGLDSSPLHLGFTEPLPAAFTPTSHAHPTC